MASSPDPQLLDATDRAIAALSELLDFEGGLPGVVLTQMFAARAVLLGLRRAAGPG
jgi:hypothetical protein